MGIARAIVTDPTLIVADEPTGDLDARSADEILNLLDELRRSLHKTILLVTHDPRAAQRAHRVMHLEKGNWSSSPKSCTTRPTGATRRREARLSRRAGLRDLTASIRTWHP